MTDIERIEQRLTAVERTVTGDDVDLSELGRLTEFIDELETVESQLDDLSERVASLEADVEALGGYASEVDSVNTDVERQAYAAFAAVDRLEERVDEIGERVEDIEATESAAAAPDGPDPGTEASPADADESTEIATTDGGEGSMGPFVPATANEAAESRTGTDDGPSLTEAVQHEENGDGGATDTTDQSSVDELFDGTETTDEPEQSSDADEEDGGFIDSLRAKLS